MIVGIEVILFTVSQSLPPLILLCLDLLDSTGLAICQISGVWIYYTPANYVCGGYTVFTLSVRPSFRPSIHPSVHPWCFGFSLISWKGNDGNSSNFADTLISIKCTFNLWNKLKDQKHNSNLLIYLCSVHNNSNILFKLGRINVSLNLVGGYDYSHNISVENREIGDHTSLKWNWNLSMLLAIRLWLETIAFHRRTAKQLNDTTQTIQWRIFCRPS